MKRLRGRSALAAQAAKRPGSQGQAGWLQPRQHTRARALLARRRSQLLEQRQRGVVRVYADVERGGSLVARRQARQGGPQQGHQLLGKRGAPDLRGRRGGSGTAWPQAPEIVPSGMCKISVVLPRTSCRRPSSSSICHARGVLLPGCSCSAPVSTPHRSSQALQSAGRSGPTPAARATRAACRRCSWKPHSVCGRQLGRGPVDVQVAGSCSAAAAPCHRTGQPDPPLP